MKAETRWVWLILYLILASCHLASIAAAANNFSLKARDLYHRRATLVGNGLDQPYQLPDKLLIENSEAITVADSSLLRGRDYQIDYLRGIVSFGQVWAATDTLSIVYQVFPFELRTTYSHPIQTLRPDQLAAADTLKTTPRSAATSVFDTGSLRKSGTLVRGITIGSDRDLSVESGLNMQVEGRLGRDLDILALLSDQNTPLQPEGNTATLQEIDKVLIQLQSTHYAATLGDYELQFTGPRFGGYYRKLQGAKLEGRTFDDSLTISGAVSKGQYHSNFFSGIEGNQGPYRLADKEGRTGILVLAGTERVWVDGVLMTRGANNDYTIEYGLGEITFAPKRLITSDSRITVDFQYSADDYGRDIYAAQGQANLGKALGLRTTVISESDARNNPLGFVLTDQSRNALSSAGDNPALAQVQQVTQVDTGQGDYRDSVVVAAGDTITIFIYARPDSNGYLNVAFSWVGEGQGSYARQPSPSGFYYEWVGAGLGNYDPILRLALPERKRLADVEIWAKPTRTTQLKIEGAASEWDKNTFSSLNDGDNVGFAWSAEGQWAWKEAVAENRGVGFSPVKLEGRLRRIEDRFTQIDRVQLVEYDRQWGIEGAQSNGETVQEAALTIQPLQELRTKALYGFLDKKADKFRSERWRGETNFSRPGLPTLTAQADWIRSHADVNHRDGFWTRGQAATSYTCWRFTPSLRYEREHKHDAYPDSLSGFLFNVYGGGLVYQAGPLSLTTTQEQREDQKYRQSILRAFSQSLTQSYQADLKSWRTISTKALYTHRRKSYAAADSAETLTDLAEINFGWTPFDRLADLLAHYRVNNTRVSSIIQIPIFVGAGQGTHVKVGDLFFETPDGDYILVAQSTGQFQPVVDLDASFSLDVDPNRLPKPKQQSLLAPWKFLASETVVNISEKTKERDVWAIYRLDLNRFQGDSTLYGSLSLREDLFLFRQRRDLSFRLRGEVTQSLSNLYLAGGQETLRRLVSLRIRRTFSEKWSVQSDIERKTDRRDYRASSASDRDILSWSGSAEPVYRPGRGWELGTRIVASRDHDRVGEILAWRYGAEPRVVRSFTEKGRIELRGEWHHVTSSVNQLPYEMAQGDPLGDNFRWDFRLDYRLSKYLTASVSYNGSKDADRDAIHVGRAEVRAFF